MVKSNVIIAVTGEIYIDVHLTRVICTYLVYCSLQQNH